MEENKYRLEFTAQWAPLGSTIKKPSTRTIRLPYHDYTWHV